MKKLDEIQWNNHSIGEAIDMVRELKNAAKDAPEPSGVDIHNQPTKKYQTLLAWLLRAKYYEQAAYDIRVKLADAERQVELET